MAFTNTDSLAIPFGGRERYFGTNPIALAAPMKGEGPFNVDMATTTVPWNKILIYQSLNKKLEPGWAVDRRGKQTLDPKQALALLPLGGYKGYSLAAAVEIMSALLPATKFGKHVKRMYPADGEKRGLGHTIIVINISMFRKLVDFKSDLKQLSDELRSSVPSSPSSAVLAPGDPEKQMYLKRLKTGIPIPVADLKILKGYANKHKIKFKIW